MTLLADLLDLPTQVHKSDFVINIRTGLARPDETLGTYVVTPQLADCFDRAVGLVASTITDQRSKAAFLHGSFGAGKSHFMAVLHLLLAGHPKARALPELHPVIARHDAALAGRRVLLVPYHFIGATTVEQVILGGYVEHLSAVHPEAPPPAVYVADSLVANAERLRSQMGDERFFAALNQAPDDDPWATGWDASRYEAAVAAPGGSRERRELVSTLVTTVLSGVPGAAQATGGGFVPLEDGLEEISHHAHRLGYHAVVLFLDELLLWLGSQAADHLKTEATKIAKLVEGDASKRPAPITSFIARQRELNELVGTALSGADKASLAEALKWWEGRFDTITLDDQNLTAIAEKRLLTPRSAAARMQIDEVFATVQAQVAQYRDVLLTTEGNLDMFRRLYPFNPALVQTLVTLSNALQRERTALKVMLQLLVDHRNRLELGQLIPLGALWDVITTGDEPLSQVLAAQLQQAKKLWSNRLEPELRLLAGLAPDAEVTGLPVTHRYVSDSLLVKSLLLAALVPDTPVLRDLTVARLVALNHGTIHTPFAGTEKATALKRLQELATRVGELRIGDDPHDPTVRIQLSGVDTRRLMDQVRTVDNFGARWAALKALVVEALEVQRPDSAIPYLELEWRGTRRRVDVVIGNLRNRDDLTVEHLRAGADPRLVVDLPMDQGDNGPRDDLARLDADAELVGPSLTACWLPVFFTEASKEALGDLVVTEYLLTGDTLDRTASDLSPTDRAVAREQLANQREQLRTRVKRALNQAFGVSTREESYVDSALDVAEQVRTLTPGLAIGLPAGTSLRKAAESIAAGLLARQYPLHPEFPVTVRDADLRRVRDTVLEAVARPDGRLEPVDRAMRPLMRQIAQPLELGTMYESHFVAADTWRNRFDQAIARDQPAAVTVGLLRQWMDQPEPRGLPTSVGDVILSVYVAQTDRMVVRAGRPIPVPDLGRWEDRDELVASHLPDDAAWERAVTLAAGFGVTPTRPLKTAAVVGALGTAIVERLRAAGDWPRQLVTELAAAAGRVGLGADVPRLATARAVVALLDAVGAAPDRAVSALAAATPASSPMAMGTSLTQAEATVRALQELNWVLLEAAFARAGGEVVRERLCRLLAADEVAERLADGLRAVQADATRIVVEPTPPPPPREPPEAPKDDPVIQQAERDIEAIRKRVRARGWDFEVIWHQRS